MDSSPDPRGLPPRVVPSRPRGGTPPRALARRRLPSGVNGQVAALLLALLTVGIFAGSTVFHQTPMGDQWLRDIAECELRFSWQPDASGGFDARKLQLWKRCVDSATVWLVTFELGFVAVALIATVVAALVGPLVSIWRRRWRTWPAVLTGAPARIAELAAEAGHRRVPRLLLGSNNLRDAVTGGVPGRYAIVLPKKLAVNPQSELFAATIRHELAHVRRHDVLVAWSTRPAIRVAGVLLLVPVITAVIDQDATLLPGYVWRAVVLLTATTAVCASILRAREFEADALSIDRPSDRQELLRALDQARAPVRGRWRRLAAFHPGPRERALALLDPGRSASVRFLDALSVSFLVAIAMPLVRGLTADCPSWTAIGSVLTPVLGGLVLGSSIGGALWRSSYLAAAGGRLFRPLPALLGVLVGFLGGSLVSLRSATGVISTADEGLAALFTPLLSAGATALVASTAIWSSGGSSPPPGSLVRLTASALPFVCAFAVSGTLATAYEGGGLSYLPLALIGIGHPSVSAFVFLLSGCCWLLVLRRGCRVVGVTLALSAAGGLLALVALASYRLVDGPPVGGAASYEQWALVFSVLASCGLATALASVVGFGRGGWCPGVAAGTGAAAVGGVLYPLFNAVVLGAPIDLATVLGLTILPQGLGFLLMVLAALATWLVLGSADAARRRSRRRVSADHMI